MVGWGISKSGEIRMKLEFMVNDKEGRQNFSNKQEEDRITKFALKLLSDWEINVFIEMLVFAFNFPNSIHYCLCKTLGDF